MKHEYDFSQGERGTFYHAEAQLELPVYLESDVAAFFQKVAAQQGLETKPAKAEEVIREPYVDPRTE